MNFGINKLNNIDLTWIVYSIAILATGICIIPSLNQFRIGLGRGPLIAITYLFYAIFFSLVPVGFVYLAFKKIRLNFKLSFLSVVGIILIIVFVRGIVEYILGGHSFSEFLFMGCDHWLFPIAFGFFYLCDLRGLPKKFWLLLLPFAAFAGILGNAILIGNSIFNTNVFAAIGGPNFPFAFFSGANNWEEVFALPTQRILDGFIDGFLQEFLTFFTLFPIVIFYYLLRKKA